jgi:hypothetical protein
VEEAFDLLEKGFVPDKVFDHPFVVRSVYRTWVTRERRTHLLPVDDAVSRVVVPQLNRVLASVVLLFGGDPVGVEVERVGTWGWGLESRLVGVVGDLVGRKSRRVEGRWTEEGVAFEVVVRLPEEDIVVLGVVVVLYTDYVCRHIRLRRHRCSRRHRVVLALILVGREDLEVDRRHRGLVTFRLVGLDIVGTALGAPC